MKHAVIAVLWFTGTLIAQPVAVGSKSFTESVILGEMIQQLLESKGYPAIHKAELGGTQILFQALRTGQLDLYVEYTGTLMQELLAMQRPRSENDLRGLLAQQGIAMSEHLGFINNYALGVSRSLAEARGLRRISDLRSHPDLRFALSNEFLGRKDGWPLLASRYALPQQPAGMSHETALAGLYNAQSDVTDLYTTDAEIEQYDLITLEDDLGVLPLYHAVLLYRQELSPQVVDVLRSLEAKIDTPTMTRLNAAVAVHKRSEAEVAASFLEEMFGIQAKARPGRLQRLVWWVVTATLEHLFLVLVSLLGAILLAIPLGITAYHRPQLGAVLLAIVGIIQTVPSMALLVLLIPLLGLGQTPALLALLLYSLLPIVRNTFQGLRDISPALRESAEVIGLTPWTRLWQIELPLASPSILAGIQTAAVINVGTATIGAFIGAGGYGQLILTGIRLNDWWLLLSGAIPAALMALTMQAVFALLEKVVVPRGLRLSG
ncbi:MAG: glycine betaine ABC transporter substrate-binding protein [Gemmataceae bacterium]